MAAASLADIRTVLSPESTTCPNWPDGIQWSQRRKFCDTYERYGDLCWCENPYSLEVNPLQIENSQIESAVTAAVAHRAPMFYESLKTLFANPGFNKSRLEVFTQEPQKELQDLLRLLDIKLTVTGMVTEGVANTIMRQFIFAISHILKKYPGTEFFIFIEDDLHFSPDFFIFLNRTAEMLLQDATLYCVSAHNDLSYPHTSYDASALLRTESFPNYGWMVRREFVVQMLKMLENSMHVEADWDIIIFHYLRGNRECIVPEISRSHHFGEGYHINQYQMNLFYDHKNYNLDPSNLVEHVHLMEQNSYEKILSELLNKSVPLDLTINPPCSESFYHALNSSENSVITIYFNLTDLAHYRGTVPYYILTECLEVYSTESREGHFGLFRMRWENKHLILIGYPASNYSIYKPNELSVFNGSDELQAESQRHFYSKPKNAFFVLDEPANYYKDFLRAN